MSHSITPPKQTCESSLTDAPAAGEEKGMSIPVIGSSECPFFFFFNLFQQVSLVCYVLKYFSTTDKNTFLYNYDEEET